MRECAQRWLVTGQGLSLGLLLHLRKLFISLELWSQRATFLCSKYDSSCGLTNCSKLEEADRMRGWGGVQWGVTARSALVSTTCLSLWDVTRGGSKLTVAATWVICSPSQVRGERARGLSHGGQGTAGCEGEDRTVRATTGSEQTSQVVSVRTTAQSSEAGGWWCLTRRSVVGPVILTDCPEPGQVCSVAQGGVWDVLGNCYKRMELSSWK